MTVYLQVSTATPTREQAIRIAGSAVKAGLAAGAQIAGPVVSVYWHEAEYGEGEEWQLTLKTPWTGTPSSNRTCSRSTPGTTPK